LGGQPIRVMKVNVGAILLGAASTGLDFLR
jgi:hypothetical protein